MTISELKRLYESAESAFDRRAICLQAIDAGIVSRGGSVSSLDTIFGTRFLQDLPKKGELNRTGVIDFAPQAPSAHDAIAAAHSGWFMAFEYDYSGTIQKYYLTNLHK